MGRVMKKIKRKIREKPQIAISAPAILCFVTFISNMIKALGDGNIDTNELHALLASADGFETVVLFIVMLVLKDRKK